MKGSKIDIIRYIWIIIDLQRTIWIAAIIPIIWCHTLTAQFPDNFQRDELVTRLTNPVKFDFASDGQVFIIDRYGELLIYKPTLQTTVSGGTLPVFHDLEDGLIGIALDPDFELNSQIYLHYSPLSPSVNRVSRFTMNEDQLDFGSEVILLEWEVQRTTCCHAGGDLAFDSKGNLYIATGDNTKHSKYATLDEIDINKSSEKSSSNSKDLRGKILRITPLPDGTYSIPDGNLFSNASEGRPEIYVMGARNPFSIFVDKTKNDWLFWSDVGPDANFANNEGPEGKDEINLTKAAGNYGWPYFSGDNEPYLNTYTDPQFYYDPSAPVNLSTWNTGIVDLPPAQPSWLDLFHDSYLAGPRYYYDSSLTETQRLPIDFHDSFFYFDFNSSQVWVVRLDEDGNIISNDPFAPEVFPVSGSGFIDMDIGPDGHLYILEYGEGCCAYSSTRGKLTRVDYLVDNSNAAPVVNISAYPVSGSVPLMVTFSSNGTFDPNGDALTYAWDFDQDGVIDSNLENPVFTYTTPGKTKALLRVSDGKGLESSQVITLYPGNNETILNIATPVDGGLFNWDDEITFELSASDAQDGSTQTGGIVCNDIGLAPSVVNGNQIQPQTVVHGCQGTLQLSSKVITRINAGGHGLMLNIGAFGPDQYVTGGKAFSSTAPIAGTADDLLYQTEIYGEFIYNIPVPIPGTYTVKLHFAELFHGVKVPGDEGDRVFSVNIENDPVLSDFDILKEVDPATVLIKEFQNITVNDGLLTIEFIKSVGNPKISAIEVIPLEMLNIYGDADMHQLIEIHYTDKGGLTASDTLKLFPKRHEAEFYNTQHNVKVISNQDVWGGGRQSIRVSHNSYISYTGRNLTGINSIMYRVASVAPGSRIELRLDSHTGPLVVSTEINPAGGPNQWFNKESLIIDQTSKHDLYFVFKNESQMEDFMDLNYIDFIGEGISTDNTPPLVISVEGATATSVVVEFSEFVSTSSAEDVTNYIIDDGILPTSARLEPDNRSVTLIVSNVSLSTDHNLEIVNIENLTGLTIEPKAFTFVLSADNPGDVGKPELIVYPNPTTKHLTLEVSLITAEAVNIRIHDSTGREIYFDRQQLNVGKNQIYLALESLTEGLYYLKVNSVATNLSGFKFLVKR